MDDAKIRDFLGQLDAAMDETSHDGIGPFRLEQAALILMLGADRGDVRAVERQKELCLVNSGACQLLSAEATEDDRELAAFRERLSAWIRETRTELSLNPGTVKDLTRLSLCLILFPGVGTGQLNAVSDCAAEFREQVSFEWLPFVLLKTGDPAASAENRARLDAIGDWMYRRENCLRCGVLCSSDNNNLAVPARSLLQIPFLTLCLRSEPEARQHLSSCLTRSGSDPLCFYTARTAAITANRKLVIWQRMQTLLKKLIREKGAARQEEQDRYASILQDRLSAMVKPLWKALLRRLPHREDRISLLPLWGVMFSKDPEDLLQRVRELGETVYLRPLAEARQNLGEDTLQEFRLSLAELLSRDLTPFYAESLIRENDIHHRISGLETYTAAGMEAMNTDFTRMIAKAERDIEKRINAECSAMLKEELEDTWKRMDAIRHWLNSTLDELAQRCSTQQQISLSITLEDVIAYHWEWMPLREDPKISELRSALARLIAARESDGGVPALREEETDAVAEAFKRLLQLCCEYIDADRTREAKLVQQCENAFSTPETAKKYARIVESGCRAPVRFRESANRAGATDILLSPQPSLLLINGWDESKRSKAINLQCEEQELRLIRYFSAFGAEDLIV